MKYSYFVAFQALKLSLNLLIELGFKAETIISILEEQESQFCDECWLQCGGCIAQRKCCECFLHNKVEIYKTVARNKAAVDISWEGHNGN